MAGHVTIFRYDPRQPSRCDALSGVVAGVLSPSGRSLQIRQICIHKDKQR